jgi:hypothetical protein
MAHELDVWLFADHVGRLSLVEGRHPNKSRPLGPAWQRHVDGRLQRLIRLILVPSMLRLAIRPSWFRMKA